MLPRGYACSSGGFSVDSIHNGASLSSTTRCSVDSNARRRSNRLFLTSSGRGYAGSCKWTSQN